MLKKGQSMKTTLQLSLFFGAILFSTVALAQRDSSDIRRTAKDSTLFQYLDAYAGREEDPRLNYKIASLYLRDDAYEKALPYALKAQELWPQNDEVHYVVARLYTYTKKNAFAIEALRKAIAIQPEKVYFMLLNLNRLLLNTKAGVLNEYREFNHITCKSIPEIEAWATDSTHPYYTPKLWEKFHADWSLLGLDEFFMLYFGQSVMPGYNPYLSNSEVTKELRELYKNDQHEAVVALGTKLFAQHPLDFNVNWYTAMSHYKLKQYVPYEKHMGLYRSLLLAITASGDGTKPETAYIIMRVSDEYEVLDFFGYQSSGQALIHHEGSSFDKLSGVDTETGENVEVYFNVDKPFNSLTKMFDGVDLDKKKSKKKKK